MKEIQRLKELIQLSNKIVFFGGAGVSTESGIPDFRSVDGLYNQKYDYPPEQILSHTFFVNQTEQFYRFYFDKMIFKGARPNAAHLKLAQLEEQGKLTAVVTQNIDGLHQLAGSKRVYELHGSVHRNYCTKCGKFYSLEEILKNAPNVPRCECGGTVKPDVVLYEEPLDGSTVDGAIKAIADCDLLIIGGTSLGVYPAASFVTYTSAVKVLINKSSTPYDRYAQLLINQPIGEVFKNL